MSFLSNLSFLPFAFFLCKDVYKNTLNFSSKNIKKESYFLSFLKYFVFVVILTNFVFIGTITIHEFGHLGISKLYDCEYSRIVYESGLPRTEILCKDNPNNTAVILGGILLPIVIAILLFFGGGKFIKEIAALVVGFNLIATYKDLLDLGISINLALFVSIIGLAFIILGVILLAKSRTEEETLSYI